MRREDARLVVAGVLVHYGDTELRTAAQFLEYFKREYSSGDKLRIGEMITGRQRLIGIDAALDNSVGATCVRYNRTTEITGQFPAFPDLVAITSTRGLFCSHPHWPNYNVDVTFQQVYPKGERPLALDEEAEAFLTSVAFTSVRPVAVGPNERYVLQMQAADAAYREERWADAEAILQAALKTAEHFGPKSPIMARALYYLSRTKDKQGRLNEAEPLLRRVLEIFDAQPELDDPHNVQLLGQTLNDLGVIYAVRADGTDSLASKQDLRQAAELHFQRALEIREESDPSQVGRTVSNLAQLYVDWGRLSDAVIANQRLLRFREEALGPEHPDVAHSLHDLAVLYLAQGKYAETEPLYRRMVAILEKALGPEHPAVAGSLDGLATLLRKMERDAEAEKLEARARAIRNKIRQGNP